MKNSLHTLFTFIILVLIILLACDQQEPEEHQQSINYFSLGISFGNHFSRTLSYEESDWDGDFNEEKINAIDLLFYEGNTLKWHTNHIEYDDISQKVIIPISQEKIPLFENNTSVTYNIYIIANNHANLDRLEEGLDNLDILKELVIETPTFVTLGGTEAQPVFLMSGMISGIVNLHNQNLGMVSLKRAASKIRIRLDKVSVPGYTQAGFASARLVHFTDKSVLLDNGITYCPSSSDWKDTSPCEMSTKFVNTTTLTTAAPFYAYSNDWNDDKSRESYVVLSIPLKDEHNTANVYHYRIPLTSSSLTGDDAQYKHKLKRNCLYDIEVSIGVLGSIEGPLMVVSGNYTIKDWSTREVLVEIPDSHYLAISEHRIVMPNTDNYELTFHSYIPDVSIVENSMKATYTYIDSTSCEPVTAEVSIDQLPVVTVAAGVTTGKIRIESKLPVNFIPKDIEFKVTNGVLTETITIQQLPSTYFTVTKGIASSDYENYDALQNAGLSNPYMYGITLLVSDSNISCGFPPTDANGYTMNNKEVARIVSPKFEIISHFGFNKGIVNTEALIRCKEYWEKAEDGTVKRNWRLPTLAELQLIDSLQNSPNNPHRRILKRKFYWHGFSDNYGYSMKFGTGDSYIKAYARCVRDIKE